MNRKRLITILCVLVALAAGLFGGYRLFLANQPVVQAAAETDAAAADAAAATISAEGQLAPARQTKLALPMAGTVVALLVEEGDRVEAGEALLRLNDADQQLALQRAETAVLQAQANVASAQAGLAAARFHVAAADVAIAAAQADLALLMEPVSEADEALQQALIAAAAAGVQQAAGNQALALAGAGAAAIRAAEADLAAAEAQLFAVRVANEPIAQNVDAEDDDREQAQLRLNAAVAGVTAAQARLDELRGGSAAGTRTAAAGAVGVARAQEEAAEAQLALLQAGARPETAAIAQANLDLAQRARAEAELEVQRAETAVSQAEAGVAEAESSRQRAATGLQQTILTAPFAGTVAELAIKTGQVTRAGVPVVTLVDLDTWRVETTDLTEKDVVNVRQGDPAAVTFDAFPGETLAGEVVDIAAVSEISRGDVTYRVTVRLADAGLPLRWGMTAYVTIDVTN